MRVFPILYLSTVAALHTVPISRTASNSQHSSLQRLATPIHRTALACQMRAPLLPSRLSARTNLALNKLDSLLINPLTRVANHAAAVSSLSYFGLISMTMMSVTAGGGMPAMAATFRAVITRSVGMTSNQAFSRQFSTLVTPANFVFLIWPAIAALQLGALTLSILRPKHRSFGQRRLPLVLRRLAGPQMSQSDLTSLALANVFATTWLITASNAVAGDLPVGSVLALPFVPLFSGLPLRSSSPPLAYRLVFQVFSAFTTIATFLAIAVELQHGGRVPWFTGKAEPTAALFLGLTAGLVSLPKRSLAKRLVNLLAITGILSSRLMPLRGAASLSTAAAPLLRSPSLYLTLACWMGALWQLVGNIRVGKVWSPATTTTKSSDGTQKWQMLPDPPPPPAPGFGERGTFF